MERSAEHGANEIRRSSMNARHAFRRKRTAVSISFVAATALLLASCALPVKLAPPASRLDSAALGLAKDAAPVSVNEDWWRIFNDPSLDGLVEKALRDNPSMT